MSNRHGISRSRQRLRPDPRRVLLRPFLLGGKNLTDGDTQARHAIDRIAAMPEADVRATLDGVLAGFSGRHRNFKHVLSHHFQLSAHHLGISLSPAQRLLIGATFTSEYAIQSAALFSPSIVPAPGPLMPGGRQRFVLSMRGVGEGHLSSIQFRTGHVSRDGDLAFDPISAYAQTGHRKTPVYDRRLFAAKLTELGANNEIASPILYPLSPRFEFHELEASIHRFNRTSHDATVAHETIKLVHMLASSNYVVTFARNLPVSERVIFPAGPTETHGMEDARFVRFTEDDGTVAYYATYTAYDGYTILPQLIETSDFGSFRIATMAGDSVQNKGMALFPRRIDGRYVMISRNDSENLFLMTSDNVRQWDSAEIIARPSRPWELIQIGNCGSPLETEAGWLVLTHGLGPMRRYAIGAMLLDGDEPGRVIGHLREPLLTARATERDGYVPNVVYSCGGMVHGGRLILPYGYSDRAIGFAFVDLSKLLDRLTGPDGRD